MRSDRSEAATFLQVVTGKGGVGKSTVAAALAMAAGRRGHRVLAIEMGAPAGLAGLLGVTPTEHGVPVDAGGGVHLAYYDGEAALAEYIRRHMRWDRVVRAIVEHPLYRAFVNAGPGVREIMAIGKVRDEMLGLATGEPQWGAIVLDAGASGHALQLLGMPSAAAQTFGSGLAHREAASVAGWLADPASTAVHVVALPEEMPLQEAAEVVERLRELGLPLGRLVVNQCRPPAPAGAAEALAVIDEVEPIRQALSQTLRRTLGWLELQERGIARLEERLGMHVERLPRLVAPSFGRAQVEQIARVLTEDEALSEGDALTEEQA